MPKLPLPPVQRPEQLAVLVLTGRHRPAVGRGELNLEQVVARETPLPLEPAGTATQRQAGDTGRRDAATSGGQSVCLGGPVEVAPGRATSNCGGPRIGVDLDGVHAAQVDDEPAVGRARAGDTVATRADRDLQAVDLRVCERRLNIGYRLTLGDECRPTVDHGVEDRAGVVVVVVVLTDLDALESIHTCRFHGASRRTPGGVGTYALGSAGDKPCEATSRMVRRG